MITIFFPFSWALDTHRLYSLRYCSGCPMNSPPPWAYRYTTSAFLRSFTTFKSSVVGMMYAVSVLLVAKLWILWNSGSLYQMSESVMKDVPYQARTSAVRKERGCDGFITLEAIATILRNVDTMKILKALTGWERICCHFTDGIVKERRLQEDKVWIGGLFGDMYTKTGNAIESNKGSETRSGYIRLFDHCLGEFQSILKCLKYPALASLPEMRGKESLVAYSFQHIVESRTI